MQKALIVNVFSIFSQLRPLKVFKDELILNGSGFFYEARYQNGMITKVHLSVNIGLNLVQASFL